jgi:DegV family protein with EDD domain
MSKVAIVTDSTAYIPEEITRDLHITSVPLQVIWGEQIYRDGIDLQPAEFYTRLKDAKVMPSTSQATPSGFMEAYRVLLDQGYEILSVHISSKLSGTLDSATQALEHFPGAKIELVDSLSTSMAMGYPVLLAARAAANGATLQECKAIAERACSQSGVYFVVSTLEFLRRGGRIGGAQAFLGTALNLKPILELRDGKIEAVERVRTMGKAIDRLLDLVAERVSGQTPLRLATLHANAPTEAGILLERAISRFGEDVVKESMVSPISPTLGTHAGPGTVGLAFLAGM